MDESGDPGPAETGGSPFYVVAAVAFPGAPEAMECESSLRALAERLKLSPRQEFHFRRDSHARRLLVLDVLASAALHIGAVAIDKRRAANDVSIEMAHIRALTAIPALGDARIVMDASGGKQHATLIGRAVRGHFGASILSVRTERSQSDFLLQAADYAAGVVTRVAAAAPGNEAYVSALRRNRPQVVPIP